MNIEWNRVTWYSKVFAVVLFVAVFYVGYNLGQQKKEIDNSANVNTVKKAESAVVPISISTKSIKEENFSGSMPVISGSSAVAEKARSYVNQTVADFRKQANVDVPEIKAKFGTDSPTANYEIDIEAKYVKGNKTDSIILSAYEYTGGANGNSSYKVFTASLSSGKILNLSDVIRKEKQGAFTALVKKELTRWSPDGSDTAVIFPDDVNALSFSSFKNWSMDDKSFVVYFDKYEVGPGALGSIAFPISLDKLSGMMAL